MVRSRYVFRNGEMVNINDLPPDDKYFGSSGPRLQIISDIPGYVSPVNGQWIDGRRARREDLARTGCREVDPSEKPAFMKREQE